MHDFEGALYENREPYEKWDPARFVDQWATPQLVSFRVQVRPPLLLIVLSDGIPCVQTIHNELDYRLPVTEGLAAFNILQARKVPSKLLVFPDENHVRWPRFLLFSTVVWDVCCC